MAEYVTPPIPVDADDLKAQVIGDLKARIAGWEPAEGNLDYWLIEAFCEVAAQIGESVTWVLRAIFRYFGSLIGVPPIEATAATTTVTVKAIDATVGRTYVVPAGTTLAWNASGELVPFQLVEDAVIASGTDTVTGVSVVAITPGSIGSGLSGVAILDGGPEGRLDFVDTITAEAVTANGADAEDDDTYMNRLADELRTLSTTPILPDDFAILARRNPAVHRALAFNGTDPDTGSTGVERLVAVFVQGADGLAVTPAVRTAVKDFLESMRETNFVVKVADPTPVTINVAYTATAFPGYDTTAVEAAADAAVAAYLDPASWGETAIGDERGGWTYKTNVRYLEVGAVLNAVDGLDEVTALTLNGSSADVDMAAAIATAGAFKVPVPVAGTITGTVS
jgi:hypothetical protein